MRGNNAQRQLSVISHVRAISGGALEATSGHEMLIGGTSMRNIRTLSVDAVDEQLDCPHMIAGQQYSRSLFDSVFDQCQWDECSSLLGQRTSRLLFPVVRIKVQMPTGLGHAVAGNFEQKETPSVRVDYVHKSCICRVQSNARRHSLEVRLSWIQASDPRQIGNQFSSIARGMRAQRVTNHMHILRSQSMVCLQLLHQVRHL